MKKIQSTLKLSVMRTIVIRSQSLKMVTKTTKVLGNRLQHGDEHLENGSGKRSNQQYPMKRNEIKSNSKPNNKNKKIKMVVIGDLQLRNLDGSKLTNEHHTVQVIPDPGARIAKMKGKEIDSATDVILIHAGTNKCHVN